MHMGHSQCHSLIDDVHWIRWRYKKYRYLAKMCPILGLNVGKIKVCGDILVTRCPLVLAVFFILWKRRLFEEFCHSGTHGKARPNPWSQGVAFLWMSRFVLTFDMSKAGWIMTKQKLGTKFLSHPWLTAIKREPSCHILSGKMERIPTVSLARTSSDSPNRICFFP